MKIDSKNSYLFLDFLIACFLAPFFILWSKEIGLDQQQSLHIFGFVHCEESVVHTLYFLRLATSNFRTFAFSRLSFFANSLLIFFLSE